MVLGVYKHEAGQELGGHAVKLMGWGIENGVKYWLLANSWNNDWGDDGKKPKDKTSKKAKRIDLDDNFSSGFFKILRGENECGIESEIVAGLPKLSSSKKTNKVRKN